MTLNKNWCSTNKIKGHFDIYYIAWSSFCSGLCRGVWSMSRLKGPFRQRLGVRRAHPTGPLSISYVIASMFSAWKNVTHFNGQWFDKINNHFWGFFSAWRIVAPEEPNWGCAVWDGDKYRVRETRADHQ